MKLLLAVFHCFYAIAKHILGTSKKENQSLLLRFITIVLTIVIIVTGFIFFTTWIMLYASVAIFLRLKHRERYGGILSGGDALYELEEKKCVMSAALVLKSKSTSFDSATFGNKFAKRFHESCGKLSYTTHRCLGYTYYLKSNVKYEDLITTSKYAEVVTRESLLDVLENEYLDCALLQDKMYRITVLPQLLQWNTKGNEKHHVILITVRHCLCDGIAMLAIAKNCLFDEFEVVPLIKNIKEGSTKSLDEVYITKNPISPCNWTEGLRCNNESSMKIAWFIEEEIKYLPIIKDIKKKMIVGFTEVILGSFISAVSDFTKQKNQDISTLRTLVMGKPMNTSTLNMINGDYNYDHITNDSMFVVLDVPHKSLGTKVIDRVIGLHDMVQDVAQSFDAPLNYIVQKMACLIPAQVSLLITPWTLGAIPIALSNMTGVLSATVDASELEGAVGFTSGMAHNGFILTIGSVGERLHVTLTANKGLVADRDELTKILTDTFKYIDFLAEEVKLLSGNNEPPATYLPAA